MIIKNPARWLVSKLCHNTRYSLTGQYNLNEWRLRNKMVATFENATLQFLKELIHYFQIITWHVIILKQLFTSGSVDIIE